MQINYFGPSVALDERTIENRFVEGVILTRLQPQRKRHAEWGDHALIVPSEEPDTTGGAVKDDVDAEREGGAPV